MSEGNIDGCYVRDEFVYVSEYSLITKFLWPSYNKFMLSKDLSSLAEAKGAKIHTMEKRKQ